MKINIISKVDISITQEDLEQLVIDKVKAHDADIVVNSIEFIQKRNPNRIAVSVDAQYGEQITSNTTDDESALTADGEDTATVGNVFG